MFKSCLGLQRYNEMRKRHYISGRQSTERQRSAVRFCEHWMRHKFGGDIESYDEVSKYLSMYLPLAQRRKMLFEKNYAGKIVYHSPKRIKRG